MKILVLCYEYPPVGGGGGRVAAQVGAALATRGHEVRVQTAGLKHLPAHEHRDGVEIIRTESFRKKEDTCSVPEMGLYVLTSLPAAFGLARRWQPDVIHVHFAVPTGAVALPVAKLTGTPYVITAHLGDVPGGVPEQTGGLFRLVNPAASVIWKQAAAVTAVSGHVATLAKEAYGLECRVILNGVPWLRKADFQINQPTKILLVGRLSVQKNPLLALRALAAVKDLEWSLEVIGEGPLGDAMKAEVRQLGLESRVIFAGWQAAPEVAARMASADILLMTSLHEGLPMVAVEALQHGLAIVGSNIGGMRDVVCQGANGFLCDLTPETFATRLRELLSAPSLLERFRHTSLEMARDFDLQKTVDSYEQVLLDAVTKHT